MRQLNIDHYQYVDDILRPEDIHESHLADRASGNTGLFIILAIILTMVHGFILYLAVFSEVWVGIPVLLHLVVSAVTIVITYAQYKSGLDVSFLALMAITCSVTGVFGAAGSLLCLILYGIFRRASLSFNEWFELIFPPDLTSEPEDVYNEITVGIDENPIHYGVMPFIDVMELGSEPQKHRALSKMTMKFHPRLAPAFHVALQDPSNAIRVQAATSVAKIEGDFMSKLEKIERAREKEPNNVHLQYALAKYYDDYAYTGLLDAEREILNREKAIDTYKAYLQQDPNSTDAWSAIGRLLFRSEKWDEASEWFRHALDKGWKMKNMILWYLECLYRTGDFQELRRVANEYGRSIIDNEDVPTDVRDAVRLWATKGL